MPKLHIGPKGGKYYLKKGKKVYINSKPKCSTCGLKSSFG